LVSVCLQASSAYKHSLKEVLALPAIASKIKDTKAAREVSALQEFYTMLTADSSRAFYGPGHVLAAAELGAIQTLLISGMDNEGAGVYRGACRTGSSYYRDLELTRIPVGFFDWILSLSVLAHCQL
jgi:hypothetical protein